MYIKGVRQKRGISPVIATTLLILIALVLAVVIIIWARAFFQEKIQKDLGNGPEVIDNACAQIQFTADISSVTNKITIANQGTVPIYGFEIKNVSSASVTILGNYPNDLVPGGASEIYSLSEGFNGNTVGQGLTLNSGDQVVVVPIIVGQLKGSNVPYNCEKNGLDVSVS